MQKNVEDFEEMQRMLSCYLKHSSDSVLQGLVVDGFDTSPGNLTIDESASKTVRGILKHKNAVKTRLNWLAKELERRAETHDNSKLEFPEILWLIQMDKEPSYPYGTPEYFDKMKRWKKFFEHHYRHNSHHPDHHQNGVADFTLADLCEFLVDVTAYYVKIRPEDAIGTIESQAERFGLGTQLTQILKNTLLEYFTYLGDIKPVSEQSSTNNLERT